MYVYNLLQTTVFPFGRGILCDRRKGEWFHSVLGISDVDIRKLEKGDSAVMTFYDFSNKGVGYSPEMDITYLEKGVYYEKVAGAFMVISPIRVGSKEYTESATFTELMVEELYSLVEKWINMPYSHGYQESYNCIAFVDDIIYNIKYGVWNPRIVANHKKYNL
jgi:hypothetical protein